MQSSTTKICAVQSFSGTLSSHTRAPRPLHACAHRLPSVARRTGHVEGPGTSSWHPNRKLRQALQPANGTTPPTPPPPCTWHARAKHVPSTSRAMQTSTDNRSSSHLDSTVWAPQTTACSDCRRRPYNCRLPLPRSSSGRPALLPCRRQLKTIPVTQLR